MIISSLPARDHNSPTFELLREPTDAPTTPVTFEELTLIVARFLSLVLSA